MLLVFLRYIFLFLLQDFNCSFGNEAKYKEYYTIPAEELFCVLYEAAVLLLFSVSRNRAYIFSEVCILCLLSFSVVFLSISLFICDFC